MEPLHIRKNIKCLRNAKGLTQKEMAEALFMDERTYSNFERGIKKSIDVKLLVAISEILETDVIGLIKAAGIGKEKTITSEEKLELLFDEISKMKEQVLSELKAIKKELQMEKTA